MEVATVEIPPVIHLIVLSLWGGVVATEAVIEIYPFRHSEMHAATIRLHYWIDLLVEGPLVVAVIVTGGWLLFHQDPVTTLHLVKVGFAGAAVAVNVFCIAVVVRRGRRFDGGRRTVSCGERPESCWPVLRSVSRAPAWPPPSASP